MSLAVASVPEGLPLLATAAQLAAAERLAKRGALVRNARSIEALGRVDVICLDKTGTLTEGRIELHEETLRLQRDGREQRWSCPPALSNGSVHPDWFDPEVTRFLGEVTGTVERDGNLAEARLCSVLESLARDSDRRIATPPGWAIS